MKLPIRLENAITKLYTAFHDGSLNAYSCHACAVGNICNNDAQWIKDLQENDFRLAVDEHLIKSDFNKLTPSQSVINSGYSLYQISMIEKIFLDTHRGMETSILEQKKIAEYNGLCAVVEYLCELDNIPNVMDYTKLFETENNEPKYQLAMK